MATDIGEAEGATDGVDEDERTDAGVPETVTVFDGDVSGGGVA